jgi:N-methylhydantoinase A
MRIAIDTGGTFTDCVYLQDNRAQILKLPSTPADPALAVLQAVAQIAPGGNSEIRHGTTVGTNTLLERTGARVAFVTTAGFEDTIAIGRQNRPKLYDLAFTKQPTLAPDNLRFGVAERVANDGTILKHVSRSELEPLKQAVRTAAPEAIALSLLFSFANPANEQKVSAALREIGVPVSVSHEILPEFREYERGSTVLINAYLAPKMQSYVEKLDSALRTNGSRLHVMQSSGGIISAAIAAQEPVRTILSGPAGGVVGAMATARAAGFQNILTFDMGGTSTDVALVNSEAGLMTSTESQILGMPVAVPMLNIHTVGAGGGSLAGFDCGGALTVGPQSAGAEPGPICYGRGEQPTVTDANLLLGRLNPNGLLGGAFELHKQRTRDEFDRSKGKLSSVEEFARGILRVANSHMEKALRRISVEQGYDPRNFVLVAFGGAGPLHACDLARALRIPKVLVPAFPGALSAYGILVSDVVREYSRTVMLTPDDPELDEHLTALEFAGRQDMNEEGLTGIAVRSLDLRYAGQGYELRVEWSDDFVNQFHRLHERRYGYADSNRPVEVVNARVRTISVTEKPIHEAQEMRPGEGKHALLAGNLYGRARLHAGDRFTGPAVVAEYSATTYIPEGATASVDAFGNLIIEVQHD